MPLPPGPVGGPAVEREVAFDMIRRGLPLAPVVVLLAAVPWGRDGATSAAVAIGVVLVNFALSAVILSRAARVSLTFFLVAALGGYVLRLGLVVVALVALRHQPWIDLPALAVTLLVTHLGLLVWESRHVSLSLAFPGLQPPRQGA